MEPRIHYYCNAHHAYALGIYVAYWAKDIARAIRIIPYDWLTCLPRIGPGAHIFTDFERLTEPERHRLALLTDRLAADGCRVLNHPLRTLRRYDLLRALHAAGMNDFNVHWLDDWREAKRFPVFVRHADDHGAPVTGLLADAAALEREARRLAGGDGGDPRDMIVVEFGNARDADGRYRKYSAYRVGEIDYASTCQSSDDWWIKYANSESGDDEQRLAFVAANPHREQLDAVWKVAGADYGRVDYCVVGGRVQTFEVNTSPTVMYLPGEETVGHESYAAQHEEALAHLLRSAAGGGEIDNPLHNPAKEPLNATALHKGVLAFGRRNWAKNWISDAPGKAPG